MEDTIIHEYHNKCWWNKQIKRGTSPKAVHQDNIAKLRMYLEEDKYFIGHMKKYISMV